MNNGPVIYSFFFARVFLIKINQLLKQLTFGVFSSSSPGMDYLLAGVLELLTFNQMVWVQVPGLPVTSHHLLQMGDFCQVEGYAYLRDCNLRAGKTAVNPFPYKVLSLIWPLIGVIDW